MSELKEARRQARLDNACNTSYYKMKLTARDWIIMAVMTLVYAVVAFYQLGSTVMPQTYWTTSKAGEYFIIDLGEEVHVSRINYFFGINTDGKMTIQYYDSSAGFYKMLYKWTTNDKGERVRVHLDDIKGAAFKVVSSDQNYDEDLKCRYLKFTTNRNNLELGEIGIFVDDSKTAWENITIVESTVAEEHGDPAALFDEPYAIPYSHDYMNSTYFDEIYHGRTGYEHLNGIRPYEWTHPPLGKLFIALGMAIFGTSMFGMRAMGTIFGILLVPLMYLFGKKLTKDSFGGFAAAFLMMFDFMHFTHSRISSIDVYGVTFVLLMFYFMYDFYVSRPQNLGLKRSFALLFASGLFMGCAISVKWNMAYGAVGLALVFAITIFEQMWHKRLIRKNDLQDQYTWTKRFFTDSILKTGIFCVLAFIVIPATLYFATFIPYMHVTEGQPYTFADILDLQLSIFKYHSESVIGETHSFQSAWYTWPVIGRPLWMYNSADNPEGIRGTIVTMGNPAVWWMGIAGVVASAIIALKNRDRRMVPIFVAILALYLPWMLVERCTFIYHYFPILPFVMLSTAYMLVYVKNHIKIGKWLITGYFVVVAALFVIFFPALTGIKVSETYISNWLLWFFPAWWF
ncbi:MAG: phospholipid carrier-dependent glycosyltransferase [Clostridiales bacterium]|nr:phospholipid carrier-dependent glycosyltransferase [Clostridiales bacterium]